MRDRALSRGSGPETTCQPAGSGRGDGQMEYSPRPFLTAKKLIFSSLNIEYDMRENNPQKSRLLTWSGVTHTRLTSPKC
jgi:hypothetical protein